MSSESKSTDAAVEDLSFEEAFNELDGTVQRLEEGEMALEEAIALYEWGMALARRCSDALDAAELKVRELTVINDQQQMGMFFEDEED
jgi:exodeoxyribonuclease VII small subunit